MWRGCWLSTLGLFTSLLLLFSLFLRVFWDSIQFLLNCTNLSVSRNRQQVKLHHLQIRTGKQSLNPLNSKSCLTHFTYFILFVPSQPIRLKHQQQSASIVLQLWDFLTSKQSLLHYAAKKKTISFTGHSGHRPVSTSYLLMSRPAWSCGMSWQSVTQTIR